MAWMAWDVPPPRIEHETCRAAHSAVRLASAPQMPGLTSAERTRRIEGVEALLFYNIAGDQFYLPHMGGAARAAAGKPLGLRTQHVSGFAMKTIFSHIANAAARGDVSAPALLAAHPAQPAQPGLRRPQFRDRYPDAYTSMRERMFNQRDVENYNGELNAQLGYKAHQRLIEARAQAVDWAQQARRRPPSLPLTSCTQPTAHRAAQARYRDDLGFVQRSRYVSKYASAHGGGGTQQVPRPSRQLPGARLAPLRLPPAACRRRLLRGTRATP